MATSVQVVSAAVADSRREAPATTKKKIPPIVSLLAGGVAGGVEAASTYPFEFAKTRLQLRQDVGSKTVAITNPITMIRHVVATEGVAKLYTGCSTLIVGTMFKASVRFLSFDAIRNSLSNEKGQLSKANGVLAGMVAGCVESAVAVTPTERIKTALIDDAKSGQPRFRGVAHGVGILLKEQGVGTFYRGLVSTTLKQASTSAVRMGSYNALRELCKSNNLPTNAFVTFGIGSVAGIVTVYATQPFDTIKTRVQSAAGSSMGEALQSVLREGGVRGLWKGSTMRLGRLVFSGGIVFTVYEWAAAAMTASKISAFH
ncbi:hypothetical protein SCUCBS95973_007936 [Sporothrix curviconia]|uniref:Solute carrier family 25 (Mitochondrial citrate transporter), member 1 n=1 Tax=Sporothrix curviconia TaxID=1260050 RepID=A0ABP0CHX9_9PEZI